MMLSSIASTPSDVELETVIYEKANFLCTKSGNRISRSAVLSGMKNIGTGGHVVMESKVAIQAEEATVQLGKFCFVGEQVSLTPGKQFFQGAWTYMPMEIGEYVLIEQNSRIEAASIGSFVWIGENCSIGPRCVLSNCCQLLPGTVLAAGTNIPPFAVFGGTPGVRVGSLSYSFEEEMKDRIRSLKLASKFS